MWYRISLSNCLRFSCAMCSRIPAMVFAFVSASCCCWSLLSMLIFFRSMSPLLPTCILIQNKVRTSSLKSRAQRNKKENHYTHTCRHDHLHSHSHAHSTNHPGEIQRQRERDGDRAYQTRYILCKLYSNTSKESERKRSNSSRKSKTKQRKTMKNKNKHNLSAFLQSRFFDTGIKWTKWKKTNEKNVLWL